MKDSKNVLLEDDVMEITGQTRITAQDEVKHHRSDDLSWLRNFRDRAFYCDLFRFHVVWDGAWRFRINDCFSLTGSERRFRQPRP